MGGVLARTAPHPTARVTPARHRAPEGLVKYKAYPLRWTTKKFKFTVTFKSGGLPAPVFDLQ